MTPTTEDLQWKDTVRRLSMEFLLSMSGKPGELDRGVVYFTSVERLIFKKFVFPRNIPDMENWYSKIYDKKDVTDPFVDVKLGQARIAKTSIIYNDLNPEWNEVFR